MNTCWFLRLPFAAAFFWHGTGKLLAPTAAGEMLDLPVPLLVLLGLAELWAALGMLAGGFSRFVLNRLATRLAALAAIPVLMGAIVMVHFPRWSFVATESHPLGGMEYPVVLLGVALYFLFTDCEGGEAMMEVSLFVSILEILAYLFIFAFGLLVLTLAVLYVIDVTQTQHAIRRNYPVIGRFRYWFEEMGTFFRQYFFAMDREEMPFNRAERSWVYRAAKNLKNTVAFGSTRDLRSPGAVLFVNCSWPTLGEDTAPVSAVTIGSACQYPFTAPSLFNVSGMSYGALSEPAVRALSKGAAMAGCWLNTGEGGLSPHHLQGGADLVVQIGTAKYGVRDESGKLCDHKLKQVAAHDQVKMFEIKLSQGAKPGKGGILPGAKVTEEVAAIRGIPVGEDSISPNRHPDINSEDDLLDMIERIRKVTGKPVGIKLVVGHIGWIEKLCTAINKRGAASAPDFITVDSADGGTGAAPMSLIDYMGLPIRESLMQVVDAITGQGLGDRIRIIASGKLITPAEVAWALCVGADFVVSARGFMFALGCIQALQCDKDSCPTGITTHNKKLQKGLVPEDKAERVKNYVLNMQHEVGVIAHACGVPEPRQLNRSHARIVTGPGASVPLEQLAGTEKVPR